MQLASGDIDVQRGTLSGGTKGVDETVGMMVDMALGQYGAKSAKIRALAVNILNAAAVGDKDYYGMAKAIHQWVRDEIRYIKDPVGQETLSYPEELAFNTKAGDCDDKVILEIALLGSLGIRAYPVVIGVRPGHFSHVYLNIVIPEGGRPGTHAGEHIPADPIMREWPLGQEAPAHKITQKKTYEDLSGLGNMTLGAYQTGPSYLDRRNESSVEPALHAALVDTASRGEILNAPKVQEQNTDELDAMFTEPAAVVFKSTSFRRLGPLGPITNAEASGAYTNDTEAPRYRVEKARGFRSFSPRARLVEKKLIGLAPDKVMRDKVNDLPDEDDVAGMGVYIDSIIGGVLNGDPVHSAVVAHVAKRTAMRARARGLNFLGAELNRKADAVHQLAKAGDKLDAAVYSDAHRHLRIMSHEGYFKGLDANKIPANAKVRSIQGALWTHAYVAPNRVIRDEPAARNITPALYTSLRDGTTVRRRNGAIPMDGLSGGWLDKVLGKTGARVLKAAPLLTTGGFITQGALSLVPGKTKQVSKDWANTAFGDKIGQIYTRASRVTAVVGSAVAGGAGASTLAANGLLPAVVGMGWAAPLMVGASVPLLALGAQKALSKPLTKLLTPAKKPTALPGTTPVDPSTINPATGQPYGTIDPATGISYDQEAINAQNAAAQQAYDPNAQAYDPYGNGTGGTAAPPVDTFGPSDMSEAYSAESATSDPSMGVPANSPMDDGSGGGYAADQVTAQGDQDPNAQLVDDTSDGSDGGYTSSGDDDTEGASAPRSRRRRSSRRTTTTQVDVPAEADDGVAPAEDVSDDTSDEDSGDLDTGNTRDSTDVSGIDSSISLTALALVGLGAWLLLRKKR
jgi:hypothetical protein